MYYRIVAIVTKLASPIEGGTFAMNALEEARALDAISSMEREFFTYSGGAGGLNVETMVVEDEITVDNYVMYRPLGLSYMSPPLLWDTLEIADDVDFILTYSTAAQVPCSASVNGGAFHAAGCWVNVSIERGRYLGIHEIAHLIEYYLKFTRRYHKFPKCSVSAHDDSNSIHCAAELGFANTHPTDTDPSLAGWAQISPEWYTAWLSGTVRGNRGMNRTAWSFRPPRSDGFSADAVEHGLAVSGLNLITAGGRALRILDNNDRGPALSHPHRRATR